jgi:exodeoxyribonuclease VII large subunit
MDDANRISTPPSDNVPEFRVSDLAHAVKRSVESAFPRVRVRAEISRVKRYGSGHIYVTLKDENAVLESVIWRGAAARLTMLPEEGLEVRATGKLSTYAKQSKYQLIIDALEPAGEGALLKMLEERRKKLAAEGLFDAARKRALPRLPRVIGVATSPQGAVIRDILHRLADRFPRHVLIWPCTVQGERTATDMMAALEGFARLQPEGSPPRPDVIILARGGGSVEDLWGFNDEALVRAVVASPIPVISAIGHETDTTLIDFAADVRAPTPTAAAELAVPVRAELMAGLESLNARLMGAAQRLATRKRERFEAASRRLPRVDALMGPLETRVERAGERARTLLAERAGRAAERLAALSARLQPRVLHQMVRAKSQALNQAGQHLKAASRRHLDSARRNLAAPAARLSPQLLRRAVSAKAQRLDALSQRLDRVSPVHALRRRQERLQDLDRRAGRAVAARIEAREKRVAQAAGLLSALSHERTLARGFALVRDAQGGLITRAGEAKPGRADIEFADGHIAADLKASGQATGERQSRKLSKTREGGQTDLFSGE